jgi:hypothetical protein
MPETSVQKLARNWTANLTLLHLQIEPEHCAIEGEVPATDSKPDLIERRHPRIELRRPRSELPHSFRPKLDRTETMTLRTEISEPKIKIVPPRLAMNELTLETNGPKLVKREPQQSTATLRVIARRPRRTVSGTPMTDCRLVRIAEQQLPTALRRKGIGKPHLKNNQLRTRPAKTEVRPRPALPCTRPVLGCESLGADPYDVEMLARQTGMVIVT